MTPELRLSDLSKSKQLETGSGSHPRRLQSSASLEPPPRCDWQGLSLERARARARARTRTRASPPTRPATPPPLPSPGLPLAAVGGAPLQGDPQHAVAQPHEERACAVQDAQAAQGLAAPRRKDVQLFQVAATEAAARGGQGLQDGARLWRGQKRGALKAQPRPRPSTTSRPGTGPRAEGSPVPM